MTLLVCDFQTALIALGLNVFLLMMKDAEDKVGKAEANGVTEPAGDLAHEAAGLENECSLPLPVHLQP